MAETQTSLNIMIQNKHEELTIERIKRKSKIQEEIMQKRERP